MAVKVTLVPVHIILPGLADITIVGTSTGLTVITIGTLVTDGGLGQLALLVIVQVTTSPLASELVVKVGPLLPAGMPLTYH